MTASTMQGDRDKCIQAGMNDFIAKPVQKRELAEMLARWLAITTNDNRIVMGLRLLDKRDSNTRARSDYKNIKPLGKTNNMSHIHVASLRQYG